MQWSEHILRRLATALGDGRLGLRYRQDNPLSSLNEAEADQALEDGNSSLDTLAHTSKSGTSQSLHLLAWFLSPSIPTPNLPPLTHFASKENRQDRQVHS